MSKQCPIFLEKGSFRLTSPFGESRGTHTHGGADGTRDGATATYICPREMDGAKVTEVLATIEGTENSSGNYVTLHKTIKNRLICLRIKHMAYGSIKVKIGQIVHAGDVLGYMGNTGHSSGAHAHVELIYPGEWVDAYPWLIGETDILGNKIGDDDMGYPILAKDEYINATEHPKDRVIKLQQILVHKYGRIMAIDGQWSPIVEQAIRDYQAENGLGVDGRCGPATINSLNRDLYAEIKKLRKGDPVKLKELQEQADKFKTEKTALQTEVTKLQVSCTKAQQESGKLAIERDAVQAKLDGVKTAVDILIKL